MKYGGMPWGMWVLFGNSFQEKLVNVLNYHRNEAAGIAAEAKKEYRKIIKELPVFEKGDRFKTVYLK